MSEDRDTDDTDNQAAVIDGAVIGTSAADDMQPGYTDASGDQIDGADGIDDTILALAGDDTVDAGEGNDTVYGGSGADWLYGGDGNDSLSGGDDQDVFVINSLSEGNNDTVSGGDGGTDLDSLDLSGVGVQGVDWLLTNVVMDSDGNGIDGTVEFLNGGCGVTGSVNFTNIEKVICFTPGTLIATPTGERKVESLREGDKVVTRDNGIQEVRWIGRRQLTGQDLARAQHLRPVRIRAGALGGGLPERDMVLSPNHRVLVSNDKTALYFDDREVLVASKHLTGLDGVDEIEVNMVTYIHFMFDQHEFVLSDGSWTESFQPGDISLDGLVNAQRTEIFELFPELKTAEGMKDYPAARRSLKKHEARALFL